MSKMLSKLLKRCRRKDTVSSSSSSSTSTQVNHLPSSLKDHLAATKIQSAFRRYKKRYNTKVSDSCGINAGSMSNECNKNNTPVEHRTTSIKTETSVLSISSENLRPSDVHSAHQGQHSPGRHAPILLNFTLGRLIKVHATMLRCLRVLIRPNPSQKANLDLHMDPSNNTDQKIDTMLKADNWKLHLEPKSRNRTLQSRLQNVSIFDCYGLCSSQSHFTTRESCDEDPDLVPVYLNVYDITPFNACLYWLGLGVHHSGVQVYGVEYAFGTDESGTPRIFKMEPKNCADLKFRKSIHVGCSRLRAKEVKNVIKELAEQFRRKDYHLINNNCNHFSTQACLRLTANSIPPWINRLARLGSLFVCNCKDKGATTEKKMKVFESIKEIHGFN